LFPSSTPLLFSTNSFPILCPSLSFVLTHPPLRPVDVLRDGRVQRVSSSTLAPGDLIQLSDECRTLPCDVALLTGRYISNSRGWDGMDGVR
jgi:hypothetical protein